MPDYSYWILFLTTAVALNLSPGPDMIYILSSSVAHGRRVGVASALGTCTGALFHVAAAALGLSAILATSAMAFSVVKYVGAAYLIFLGIKSLRSGGASLEAGQGTSTRITPKYAFRQGMLVDILNPKVAIFFMAFLPQFVRPTLGHVPLQLLVLGLLIIVVSIPVECCFALVAGRTSSFLRNNRTCSIWLDRALGSLLVVLGLRLAFSGRNV